VYLLTTTAAGFFEHLGFRRADRASTPEAILGTRQASSICTSAALLKRSI
jgi:amino-acid N-acetyltransferase